jgi:hypothetical protein
MTQEDIAFANKFMKSKKAIAQRTIEPTRH